MSVMTTIALVVPWVGLVVFIAHRFRALRELDRICDRGAPVTSAKAPTPRRTYAREVIDPRPRRKRGACGVLGCPNVRPHSHVADLMRRLKEPRQ